MNTPSNNSKTKDHGELEIVYRGHGGLVVATKAVEDYAGKMVKGNYYLTGYIDAEDDYLLQVTAFQTGPIDKAGRNGTTNEAEIAMVIHRLEIMNEKFPCLENVRAINGLKEALKALEERTREREQRGVEGKLEI